MACDGVHDFATFTTKRLHSIFSGELFVMKRIQVLGLLLVLGMAGTASAQVEMRWKFDGGAPWETATKQRTAQTLTIAGNDIVTSQEQQINTTTTPGKRQPDGALVVKTQFNSLKSKLQLPMGVALEFDSAKAVEPEGTQFDFVLDIFKALSKMQVTATYDKENQVTKVVVDPKPFEDLDENAQAMIKEQTDPEYLKTTMNKELSVVPSKPVRVGDTWEVENTARLSGGQSLTFTHRYTYEGTVEREGKKVEKVTSEATKVSYSQQDGSPLKVTGSDLKVKSDGDYYLFDRELGQIVEKKGKSHITGSMTFEVGGMTLDGKLDLTLENTATVK
jgi:hypothetical protein